MQEYEVVLQSLLVMREKEAGLWKEIAKVRNAIQSLELQLRVTCPHPPSEIETYRSKGGSWHWPEMRKITQCKICGKVLEERSI